MNGFSTLLLTKDNGVCVVTINRPKALNALNSTVVNELNTLADDLAADASVKAVIITGSGEKSFVAGADITEMRTMSVLEARAFAKKGQLMLSKIENLPMPVIAAINGYALGGGCELCMACDIRYASDTARFGQPEAALGVCPGFGGTQRLPRLVGKGRAKELLFGTDAITAQEAYRIGLVNKVVTPTELLPAARARAAKILCKGSVAVTVAKACVNAGMNIDLGSGCAYEGEAFGLCFGTRDQKEGMGAFVDKRVAAFKGQ